MIWKMFLILSMTVGARGAHADESIFRFHLATEPVSLDPTTASSTTIYLFGNIGRGLYHYETNGKLVEAGAKSCTWKSPTELICELNPNAKWSDGQTVAADDYVQAWRHLVTSKTPSSWALSSIRNIRGALDIFSGKAKPEALGIEALSKTRLKITLIKKDAEFLYRLANESLVPTRVRGDADAFKLAYLPTQAAKLLSNGPYQTTNWLPHQRVHLKPNLSFSGTVHQPSLQPDVEVLFVDDDLTALNLYESGTLSLLKRLPTSQIPKMKSRPDYREIPLANFDYVGFGEDLWPQPKLREALSISADFVQLQKIFHSNGQPGCAALPEGYLDQTPCLKFDAKAGKAAFENVPAALQAKTWPFMFSALGGDDHVRGAQWWQAQWRTNLGLKIELRSTEQTVLTSLLHSHPPAIFRKGVALDRPTCLAALELFSHESPENLIGMNDPAYEKILARLGDERSSSAQKRLCREGVERLMRDHRLIPLGRYSASILVRPDFEGWTINELNQLSLDHLKRIKIRN